MYSITDQISDCKLTFEGQESWIGTYKEAKNLEEERREFLEERCALCFEDFLDTEQVIVFPCKHGLHEHCFKPWGDIQRTCPVDRAPMEGISKCSLLGYSLLFPGRARKFGTWLATHQDEMNAHIQKTMHELLEKRPETLEKLMSEPGQRDLKAMGQLLESILQGALNAYDMSMSREQMDLHVKSAIENFKSVSSQENLDVKKIAKEIDFNNDLASIQEKVASGYLLENLLSAFMLQLLANGVTGLATEHDSLQDLSLYFSYLINNIVNDPLFSQVAAKVDRRFFKHHFTAISALTSEENFWGGGERYSYLSKLEGEALSRLKRLTNGSDSVSLDIQRNINKIENINKLSETAMQVAAIALPMGVCFWAIATSI